MATKAESNTPSRPRAPKNAFEEFPACVRDLPGYIPPTPYAEVRVTEIYRINEFPAKVRDHGPESPEPTSAAELQLKAVVPGDHAGQLLEVLTLGVGSTGIVGTSAAILKFGGGNPDVRLSLCVAAIIVVGWLTRVVIHRRR
jgi:hypothetical protein